MLSTRLPAGRLAACALLLCAAIAQPAAAQTADMHQHGQAAPRGGGASGPVREIALPAELASAQSIAIDSAGRVWFAEKVGRKLARVDADTKTFEVHTLPASWGELGFSAIAIGADDSIWFTVNRWAEGSEEARFLGRFTPADGYFTKFALPGDVVPRELMVDAQGVIWFFAANRNHLYRVDAGSLAMKGYPIPTPGAHPRGLVADREGRVWFALANANRIAVFLPQQGAIEEHELPTPHASPGGLAVDAQGKVWFAEVSANRIGVFYPDKKRFDEVIVPTPGSAPVGLVVDDRGKVWFLQYAGNKVAAFDPESARFFEYDIPTYGSLPAGMALDRERSRLWFTLSATEAKRLGMVAIDEALAAGAGSGAADAGALGAQASSWPVGAELRWIALLALVCAALALGGWFGLRSRKRRPAREGPAR